METVKPEAHVITPTEASLLTVCALFTGVAQTIDNWAMIASALDVKPAQIEEVIAIGNRLQAWCQGYKEGERS